MNDTGESNPTQPAGHRRMLAAERLVATEGRADWTTMAVVRIGGSVAPEWFAQAAASLRGRHRALRSRVVRQDGGRASFMVELTPEELAAPPGLTEIRVIAREDDTHWQRLLSGLLAEGMAVERGEMMRVVLLRGPEICEVMQLHPHVVCNGLALMRLADEFLRLAGGVDAGEIGPVPAGPPDAFPTARLGWRMLAGGLRRPLAWAARRPRRNTAEPHVAPYVETWTMDATLDRAVRHACRTRDTTTTALLAVCLLRAFQAVLPARSRDKLSVSADPAGLGPAPKGTPSTGEMMAVASWADVALGRERGEDLGAQARRLKADLTRRLAGADFTAQLAVMEAFSASIGDIVDLLIARRAYQDATLSMMGTLSPTVACGRFEVLHHFGGVGTFPWRNTSFVFASRHMGSMTFHLVSREAHLRRADARAIRNHMMEALRGFADAGTAQAGIA